MNISSFDPNEVEHDSVGEFKHNSNMQKKHFIEVPDAQANFDYDPPCGNGIDEDLFNKVVNVLEKQDCDKRGPDYSLYNEDDMARLKKNDFNKLRYNLTEGFGWSEMTSPNFVYWFLVILLVVLIVLIYRQNYNPSK